jgi:hypothetical protein
MSLYDLACDRPLPFWQHGDIRRDFPINEYYTIVQEVDKGGILAVVEDYRRRAGQAFERNK